MSLDSAPGSPPLKTISAPFIENWISDGNLQSSVCAPPFPGFLPVFARICGSRARFFSRRRNDSRDECGRKGEKTCATLYFEVAKPNRDRERERPRRRRWSGKCPEEIHRGIAVTFFLSERLLRQSQPSPETSGGGSPARIFARGPARRRSRARY